MSYDNWKLATPDSGINHKIEYQLERITDALNEYIWERERLAEAKHVEGIAGSYQCWIHALGCYDRLIARLTKIKEYYEDI